MNNERNRMGWERREISGDSRSIDHRSSDMTHCNFGERLPDRLSVGGHGMLILPRDGMFSGRIFGFDQLTVPVTSVSEGTNDLTLIAGNQVVDPLDHEVEHGGQEDAEEGDAEHPGEDRGSQGSPHLGAGPFGNDEGDHAE